MVAHGARERLLAVHRRRLRWQDLEDCYGQATLELIAQALRGELRCTSRSHIRHVLEQRFVSRIRDRRRALGGRSPAQALLEHAIPLGPSEEPGTQLRDAGPTVEQRAMLRQDLHALLLAAQALTPDQRLVLAHQASAVDGEGRAEFCCEFGWSHEKYRKVAQRARKRLRRSLAAIEAGATPAGASQRAGEVGAASRDHL